MESIRRFLRLVSSVKRATRRFVVSQLFLVGMVLCNLLIPRMIQTIADEGIAKQDLDVVVNMALRMVLFAFISALLQIINAGYAVGFSVRVAHGLRTRLYQKIQTLSFGNLDRFQTNAVLVRLTSDVNVFKQMIMLVTALFYGPLDAGGIGRAHLADHPSVDLAIPRIQPRTTRARAG
jgi:ATP-binding cassette subfamily B protein